MKTFVDKLSSLEGNRYGGAIEGLSRQVFMGTEENIVTGCVNLVSCKLNVNLKVLLSGMYEFIIPPAVGVFCQVGHMKKIKTFCQETEYSKSKK